MPPVLPTASPRALPARLWLGLHLPQLALDALGPWPPGPSPGRWVWQAETGGRRRSVLQADAAARALGIDPGLRAASAQALAPQSLGRPRAPAAEAALLERLALSLGRLTPQIVVEPAGLLLEIRASLRLFGGLRALLQQADTLARALGATPCWSLAPTPLAAGLLAQAPPRRRRCVQAATARRRLLALPLEALRSGLPGPPEADHADPADTADVARPAATQALLHTLGLRQLGDLQRLPRSGLQRRGAGAWLDALDRALGLAPDPRPLHQPPETFSLGLELAWRADDALALDQAAEPLLQALCGWLQRRALAAQRLRLELRHEYRARRALPPQSIALDLAQPSADAATLRLLLREHLMRCTLQAPVDALRLRLEAALPAVARPGSLLPASPDAPGSAQELAGLVDRLQARLGRDRVRRLQVHPDARPEQADRWSPADAPATRPPPRRPLPARSAAASALLAATRTAADQPEPAPHRPPRPSWLLEPPQPLALQHERPQLDGRPLRLLGRAERIDTGWHDGLPVRRDYHLALAADGRLCWIYLDRATAPAAPEPATPRWYLHGLFG